MAKLSIIFTAFAVLFMVANASIYRTTIEIEEDRQKSSCQEQIQREQQLRQCQQHIRQEVQGRSHREDTEEEALRACCQQLQKLDSECVCKGLERAVEQQRERQQGRRERMEAEDLYDVARELPARCGVRTTRCELERNFW